MLKLCRGNCWTSARRYLKTTFHNFARKSTPFSLRFKLDRVIGTLPAVWVRFRGVTGVCWYFLFVWVRCLKVKWNITHLQVLFGYGLQLICDALNISLNNLYVVVNLFLEDYIPGGLYCVQEYFIVVALMSLLETIAQNENIYYRW